MPLVRQSAGGSTVPVRVLYGTLILQHLIMISWPRRALGPGRVDGWVLSSAGYKLLQERRRSKLGARQQYEGGGGGEEESAQGRVFTRYMTTVRTLAAGIR